MGNLVDALKIFRGKRVLITGDTGFKGSWLTLWLANSGADVYGYALEPEQSCSHFKQLNLESRITHKTGDIRDHNTFKNFFKIANPDVVFHLAAQALVRKSYLNPKETFDTNIGGSINVLECIRESNNVKVLIYITSDKCYQNNEWIWGYRENDKLGGKDPYSASKAAAEIVFSAYGSSFFHERKNELGYASVRAGNVIGGGDWSENRIVPDCIKSLRQNKEIIIRSPTATRPWQHVLEPLSGYIILASALYHEPEKFSSSWNFGPKLDSAKTVYDMAQTIINNWGNGNIHIENPKQDLHEANLLQLNCDKAKLELNWQPRWNFNQTLRKTVEWYKNFSTCQSINELSGQQINEYMETSL